MSLRQVVAAVGSIVLMASLAGRAPAQAPAQEAINSVEFRAFSDAEKARAAPTKPMLLGDRMEYWADDVNGQFYAVIETPPLDPAPAPAAGAAPADPKDTARLQELIRLNKMKAMSCRIRITQEGGAQVAEKKQGDVTSGKVVFLVNVGALKPGKYVAQAILLDAQGADVGKPVEFKFTKVDKKNPVIQIPADGIPINLEKQEIVPDVSWPVRMGVPLPINAVTSADRLALFEDGKQVPARIQPTATWCPKGSLEWVLVDFIGNYKAGKAADYRLKLMPAATESPKGKLSCVATPDKIRVDTGFVRFDVNRKKFAGIEMAWFDPNGAGKYAEDQPVIKGPGGPYIVDGRLIEFRSSLDDKPTVTIEENSPVRVTIRATGWYGNAEHRVGPLCQYITRITACAGEPMIRVTQQTILTYDTGANRLADCGFTIATASEKFRLGADGATKEGNLPAAPATAFLHQERSDQFRIVGAADKPITGKRSDGWFAVRSNTPDAPELAVVLREIWQKFPKEVEMGRDAVTLHFWPKHGRRTFTLAEELDIKNIYKFWCFHQGPMLDLRLPMDYYEKFAGDYAAGTVECRPEHALNGNGQGLTISNEFALMFSVPKNPAALPAQAKLFHRDPTASSAPEWNAATNAMGKLAAVDTKNFTAMEEAVEKGYLSHTRAVERGDEYGMWNYCDTHTYWNSKDDCAELHRVWHGSHYHEVGKTWLMYFRSGSPDLLRWARPSTDHWMNVDTCNYGEMVTTWNGGKAWEFKGHAAGAMYHCKGLTHWGGEEYGMVRRDTHSGLWGHWVDPDAFLWAWYIDGNPRAKEMYQIWAQSLMTSGAPVVGTRREANTTEAILVDYYQASWDADALPSIYGMGLSLRTLEPLEKQNPGPMWHPLWINRYYEMTRDPDYKDFILKYARMPAIENTWTLALGALAYDISGDKTYLTQHLGGINNFPRKFYHAPGDIYDWYGVGPGPLGSSWAYMQWGYMLRALQTAGITSPVLEKPAGAYPWTPPTLTVLALKKEDKPFTLHVKASSFGGDLHPEDWAVISPSGKTTATYKFKGGGPSAVNEDVPVAPDGETGLYRITVNTHVANVSRPVTDLPAEVALIPNDKRLASQLMANYVLPVGDQTSPVTMVIDSDSDITPCNFAVSDATGKTLAQGSLFRPRGGKTVTVTLDPAKDKLPWKIDSYGFVGIKMTGKCDNYIMADSPDVLKTMYDKVAATLAKPVEKPK